MDTLEADIDLARLRRVRDDGGRVVLLTGAGLSAASGIPTFRGPEGYWTVGSESYHPQELATAAMFSRAPELVWPWYLYRLGVCRSAEPNDAHHALARLDAALDGACLLVTQNVDGLHARAGHDLDRTYAVHGSIDRMRCADACTSETWPVPDAVRRFERGDAFDDETAALLRCPSCSGAARPHVLWFDEYYGETLFRFESSIRAAAEAEVLITVGTSGATNLPRQVASIAARNGAALIDVNPERNPFSELAVRTGGAHIEAPAAEALPRLVEAWLA